MGFKSVNTQLSNDEIKKLQKEILTLKIKTAQWIINRGNKPSKMIIITTDGSGMLKTIIWGKRQQKPEHCIPRVLQCLCCQRFWHTCIKCRCETTVCRYCSGTLSYGERTLEIDNTDYKTLHKLPCNHDSRYLGCPSLRDSREAMKIAFKINKPYKEAEKNLKPLITHQNQ